MTIEDLDSCVGEYRIPHARLWFEGPQLHCPLCEKSERIVELTGRLDELERELEAAGEQRDSYRQDCESMEEEIAHLKDQLRGYQRTIVENID